MDDKTIYQGYLKKAPSDPARQAEDFGQTILFTNERAIVESERRNVYRHGEHEQTVVYTNEGRIQSEAQPECVVSVPRPSTAMGMRS